MLLAQHGYGRSAVGQLSRFIVAQRPIPIRRMLLLSIAWPDIDAPHFEKESIWKVWCCFLTKSLSCSEMCLYSLYIGTGTRVVSPVVLIKYLIKCSFIYLFLKIFLFWMWISGMQKAFVVASLQYSWWQHLAKKSFLFGCGLAYYRHSGLGYCSF